MKQKGLVVESSDGWAVILQSDGQFKRVSTPGRLYIGEPYVPAAAPYYKPAVAAALLLMTLLFSLSFFPVSVYAKLSPGVELGINRWGFIVSFKVSSSEGARIISGLHLWGHSIDSVLPELLGRMEEQAGLGTDANITLEVVPNGLGSQKSGAATNQVKKVISITRPEHAVGYWVYSDENRCWQLKGEAPSVDEGKDARHDQKNDKGNQGHQENEASSVNEPDNGSNHGKEHSQQNQKPDKVKEHSKDVDTVNPGNELHDQGQSNQETDENKNDSGKNSEVQDDESGNKNHTEKGPKEANYGQEKKRDH